MVMVVKKFWQAMGRIELSVILFWLLVADLTFGYLSLMGSEDIFRPLNDVGLIEWILTYGRTFPLKALWLGLLIILLFFLGLNTFVCTTDKVMTLIGNRFIFSSKQGFYLRLSPHIMHYALILILAGYILSYLFCQTFSGFILVLNQEATVPGTKIKVRLNSMHIDYYHGRRLVFREGRAMDVRAELLFSTDRGQDTRSLGLNSPCWFRGLTFHIAEFGPASRVSLQNRPYLRLTVKKDPGLYLYFTGTMLFVIGLLLYLCQWLPVQTKRDPT